MKEKKQIMKEMREDRKEQGLKRKEFYLTDDEHGEMKKYLKKLRDNN